MIAEFELKAKEANNNRKRLAEKFTEKKKIINITLNTEPNSQKESST